MLLKWRRAQSESSRKQCVFLCFLLLITICKLHFGSSNPIQYSRQCLIHIGTTLHQLGLGVYQHARTPAEITRAPGSPWIIIPGRRRRKHRRERKQKRGCRAGVPVRLRKNSHRPPLPCLFVTNARSLNNKMDELRLCLSTRLPVPDSCVMLITETWLHPGVPDAAIELAGYANHRSDRNKDSGETRGGWTVCLHQ